MTKEIESHEEQLKKAALEGVIMRLEQDQAFYVVRFMKNCSVPELIYESKKVKELAINHLTKGFDHEYVMVCFGGLKKLKMAIELLRSIRVSEEEITKVILDYFEEYREKHSGRLPHDFGYILQEYPIPVKVLNKNKKLLEAARLEVANGHSNGRDFCRLRAFLKYFTFPQKDIRKMVERAVSDSAFKEDDDTTEEKADLEAFIKEANLNRGEMLALVTKVIADLISDGFMEEVEVLVKKYSVNPKLFVNEKNKKAAVEGVLRKLSLGEVKETEEAKQMICTFGLVRADFEDKALEKVIKESYRRGGYDRMVEMIAFANWPFEITANFLRTNLSEILRLDLDKLKAITGQYGISWDEVVVEAKNSFVRALANSGGRYYQDYIEKFGFDKEFLTSEPVVNAAKEGLIVLYKYADHDNNIGFLKETFGIS